jgi:hypothetical protein
MTFDNEQGALLVVLLLNVSRQSNQKWPIDQHGRSLKRHFFVLDWTGFFGSGANEGEHISCASSQTNFSWTRQTTRISQADLIISHDASAGESIPFEDLQLNEQKQQYTMAFVMESEVHSSTGDEWKKFNFKMSYNLDDSYPEPATYFDVNIHLTDLLTPATVPFDKKETSADIVWIISNCHVSSMCKCDCLLGYTCRIL